MSRRCVSPLWKGPRNASMLEVVKRSTRCVLMGLAVSALGAAVAVRSPASGVTDAAEPPTSAAAPRLLVPLASLVPAGDPLAAQDLRFDARFAALALDYFRTGDERFFAEIPLLPATAHLLAHARNFD